MAYLRSPPLALVCAMASGCASKLDFDSVSAGPPTADAEASQRDARVADPTSASLDASGPPNRSTPDFNSGELGGELFGGDASASDSAVARALADAGPPLVVSDEQSLPDGTPQPDPASFACANLQPPAWLCDDFESLDAEKNWLRIVVPEQSPPTGRVDFDDTDARAGRYSLLAEVNAGVPFCNDDGCLALSAGFGLPDPLDPGQLRIEFDLRVEQIDPTPGRWATLLQLGFGEQDQRSWQTLQIDSVGSTSIYAGLTEYQDVPTSSADAGTDAAAPPSPESVHTFYPVLTLNQWAHVVYLLDAVNPGGAGNSARLLIDGGLLFDGPLDFPLHTRFPGLQLGVPWLDLMTFSEHDTTQSWRVRYDNVVVRIEPR